MIIRRQQMELFRDRARSQFESEMLAHLRNFAPGLYEIRGEEAIRNVIRISIERARKYGFDTRGPVRLYLELMFTSGCGFDTDMQLPWAGQILNDVNISDQASRAGQLYYWANDYHLNVAGPENEYLLAALRRLRQHRQDMEKKPDGALEESVAQALWSIYPQKAEYLGRGPVHALIRSGLGSARSLSIESSMGVFLLIALQYTFGQSVLTDPLYPWVADSLSDSGDTGAKGRTDRLNREMVLYLDRLLDGLARG